MPESTIMLIYIERGTQPLKEDNRVETCHDITHSSRWHHPTSAFIKSSVLGSSWLLHDLCSSCPCSSTRAKLLRLKRALLGRRGDLQEEGSATITSGKVETIQKKCSTFTKEKRSGLRVISTDNTHEPGGGMLLDCSRS